MTKKDLIEQCRKILYKETIDTEDKVFLKELLKSHPEYDMKVGCGIKDFFVEKTTYGTLGFNIIREDGSTTDFSFMQCVSPKSKLTEIKCACRTAIRPTIEILRKDSSLIVHHHFISFDRIVSSWLRNNPDLDLSINETQDNSQETYFLNPNTIKSFIQYHQDKATLVQLNQEQHKEIHSERLVGLPFGEFNKDLTENVIHFPKSASQTSLNPDIKRT